MRLRKAQGRLKIEHSIIDGVRSVLERVLADNPEVRSVIPGVIRPDTNLNATQPEVDVKIDRRKAAQYGLTTGEIASDIATATSGTIASYFQINGVQYPILVEAPALQRRSFDAIAEPLATRCVSMASVSANGWTSRAR